MTSVADVLNAGERFNLDWLLGPRDWCVIDDGMTGRADDIYAVPKSRVDSGDVVTFDNLRRGEASRIASTVRNARSLQDMPRIANGWKPKPRSAAQQAASTQSLDGLAEELFTKDRLAKRVTPDWIGLPRDHKDQWRAKAASTQSGGGK